MTVVQRKEKISVAVTNPKVQNSKMLYFQNRREKQNSVTPATKESCRNFNNSDSHRAVCDRPPEYGFGSIDGGVTFGRGVESSADSNEKHKFHPQISSYVFASF